MIITFQHLYVKFHKIVGISHCGNSLLKAILYIIVFRPKLLSIHTLHYARSLCYFIRVKVITRWITMQNIWMVINRLHIHIPSVLWKPLKHNYPSRSDAVTKSQKPKVMIFTFVFSCNNALQETTYHINIPLATFLQSRQNVNINKCSCIA